MAYITSSSGCSIELNVYLTPQGRRNFVEVENQNPNEINKKIIATKYGVTDGDINYLSPHYLTGETVSDITGDHVPKILSISDCLLFNPNILKERQGYSTTDNFFCSTPCLPDYDFNFENCLNMNLTKTGSSEYVVFSASTSAIAGTYNFFKDDFTISSWIKQSDFNKKTLLTQYTLNGNYGWGIYLDNNVTLNNGLDNGDKFVSIQISEGTNQRKYYYKLNTYYANDLNNILFTKENDTIRFYNNGSLLSPYLYQTNGLPITLSAISFSGDILVGKYPSDNLPNTYQKYKGYIDELFIHNRKFTTNQVLQYYNNGLGANVDDLNNSVLYAPFNSVTGRTAYDLSQHQNNGSLCGYSDSRVYFTTGATYAPAWDCETTDCDYGCYLQTTGTSFVVCTATSTTFNIINDQNLVYGNRGHSYSAIATSNSIANENNTTGFTMQFWLKIDNLNNASCYPLVTTHPITSVTFSSGTTRGLNEWGFEYSPTSYVSFMNLEQSNGFTVFAVKDEPGLGYIPSTYSADTTYKLGIYLPPTNQEWIDSNRDLEYIKSMLFTLNFPQYEFEFRKWYHVTLRYAYNNYLDRDLEKELLVNNDLSKSLIYTGATQVTETVGINTFSYSVGNNFNGLRMFVNGVQDYYGGLLKSGSNYDFFTYSTLYPTLSAQGYTHAPIAYAYNPSNLTTKQSDLMQTILGDGNIDNTHKLSIFQNTLDVSATTAMSCSQFYSTIFYYSTLPEFMFITPSSLPPETSLDFILNYTNSRPTVINIDELKIYDKPISNEKILNSYNCEFTTEDLKLYYDFNQETGVIIEDLSGNNYDGQLSGSTGTNFKCIR